MKKLLPLLCITCVFLSGCFREKTYHDNGNLRSLQSFKDGKRHGETKLGRKNGKLERIGSFNHGKREGEWKEYHKNGKLMRTEKYEDGKLISKKGLTRSNKIFEKEELVWNKEPLNGVGFVDENDKKSGEWKLYRKNGKIRAVGSHKDGKREGEWKKYHKNGKLEKIEHYKNGELIKTEKPE